MAAVIAILITVATTKAQAPQLMSFQSVVRDNTGKLVASHSVGLRLSILQGSITGTAVYVETQTATSNANGLVTLQVGGGTVVSGTFSAIDWSAGPYYIKSEIDPTGGTSYLVAGTTQLLSVAYALYANKAGSVVGSASNGSGHTVIYDSAGTYNWVVPDGITSIIVEALAGGAGGGGGGGGGGSSSGIYHGAGGGGGASGQYKKIHLNVKSKDTIAISVGIGGIGGVGGVGDGCGGNGLNGGITVFGNYFTLNGGGGGGGGCANNVSICDGRLGGNGVAGVATGNGENGSMGSTGGCNSISEPGSGGTGGSVKLLGYSGGSGGYISGLPYGWTLVNTTDGESNGAGGGGGIGGYSKNVGGKGGDGKNGLIIIYY